MMICIEVMKMRTSNEKRRFTNDARDGHAGNEDGMEQRRNG